MSQFVYKKTDILKKKKIQNNKIASIIEVVILFTILLHDCYII
jgi:hypothetical protein